MSFDYAALRRRPDVEAPNLQAWDATDELLVEHALAAGVDGSRIAVIGDEYGAITLALTDAGFSGIRVHQDLATGRRALARNADELGLAGFSSHELDDGLLAGARLVLLQLPKALADLEEIADAVARWATPDVALVAGGRVKHMTLTQNEVLGRCFASVQAQRAVRKSRLVVATGAQAVADAPYPVRASVPVPSRDAPIEVVAHGAAFAGAKLDIGTRVLLEVMGELEADGFDSRTLAQPASSAAAVAASARRPTGGAPATGVASDGRSDPRPELRVVDLGCGTGILATAFALNHPEALVTATDRSAAAAASARATAAANGVTDRVTVTLDDAGSELPDAAADLILLNPPFHLGQSVHAGAATRLFEAAARLLRPGGALLTVFNSSLAYRAELTRLIGPTQQLHRTTKFTVTRSIRR